MLYAIKGEVAKITKKSIIIGTSDFDYEVLVINPQGYRVGEFVHLNLHHVIKEDDEYLVGFKSDEEKNAYKLLNNVQGIGPKSAISILSSIDCQTLLTAISNNNIDFIASIPGVSDRMASQIMLDLKDYIIKENKNNSPLYSDVKLALRNLNFKVKDIDRVLPRIYIPNATRDELIKEALRRLKTNV